MEDIRLQDFQEQDFGQMFGSDSESAELRKAIIAGDVTGRDTTDLLLTGEPLKAESLEATLRLTEFRQKDIKLWNAVPKLKAYNTVEEYLLQESYGTDRGGFYGEGELSDVEDSKFRRKAQTVKYIQVTKQVTLQAQTVRSHVAAMQQAVKDGVMWITRRVNTALTKAAERLDDKQFNSYYEQHASIGSGAGDLYLNLDAWQDSNVVIDMRGASITQGDFEDAAVQIDANFGNVDTFFAPPSVISGINKDYFERQRIIMNATGYRGTPGVNPKAIDTQYGDIALNQDKFMKKTPYRLLSDEAISSKAPNEVTATTQALTGAYGGSRFKSGETHTGALGTVFYAVAAVNQYGESKIKLVDSSKIALTAGQSVDLNWNDGGGSFPATHYVVYRSKVTAATDAAAEQVKFYPLFSISKAEKAAGYDGASANLVRDNNRFLPDTEEAFITEMVEEVMSFKQLTPISKLDLAVTAPANQFITFLWGMPMLYLPKKFLRFINVGPFVAS